MKKYIYIAFCLLMIGEANAQDSQPATLQVFYNFKHQKDAAVKDNSYRERMVLWLGKTASVYHSYEKVELDSIFPPNARVRDDGKGGYIVGNKTRVVSDSRVYKYPNEKKMVLVENLFKTYAINADYPVINWTILPDTMTIAGYKCQKATGDFKGRNYTAWFAPDLPYNDGPWKLNGLPGLIIEAYDKNREIEFLFAGIKNGSGDKQQIAIDKKEWIPASNKEYNRLLNLLREDAVEFFKHVETYGFRFVPKDPGIFKGYKKENNPIELEP